MEEKPITVQNMTIKGHAVDKRVKLEDKFMHYCAMLKRVGRCLSN